MPRYQLITLVDITRTNPTRSETDQHKLKQQANFDTLLQSIGLRSNVNWDTDPKESSGALPHPLNGKANYWSWIFEIEREDTFLKDGDPVGLLLDDLHGVPVVDGLNNSVELTPSAFQTRGLNSNIWIREIT